MSKLKKASNALSNNKKNVQRITAWAFMGATLLNFIDHQTSATVLGLVAGVSFFVDVVVIKEKKKKML